MGGRSGEDKEGENVSVYFTPSMVSTRRRVLMVIVPLGMLLALPNAAASQTGDLPTVSVSGGSATEGADVVFTVSLSANNEQTVTVKYATSSGTATSGTDFTAASGTLGLCAGDDIADGERFDDAGYGSRGERDIQADVVG